MSGLNSFSGQPEAALAAKMLASFVAERQSTGLTLQLVKVDDRAMSVSPDGRYVSIYDDKNRSPLVRIQEVATGQTRLLGGRQPAAPPPGHADPWGAFSRDGKQIAYMQDPGSERPYEIWAADLTGDANPRPLFTNNDREFRSFRPTDWSPDGTKIAGIVGTGVRPQVTYSICAFSVRDRRLQVFPATETVFGGVAAFSPDGKYVGFTRQTEREGTRTEGPQVD